MPEFQSLLEGAAFGFAETGFDGVICRKYAHSSGENNAVHLTGPLVGSVARIPADTPVRVVFDDIVTPYTLSEKARRFAQTAHEGATRKFKGPGGKDIPYFKHVEAVACLLIRTGRGGYVDEIETAAGYLHDILEDTNIPASRLKDEFGNEVLVLVQELTNPSHVLKASATVTRVERRMLDWIHLATISHAAKRIKLADRICNLIDRDAAPHNFLQKYIPESRVVAELCRVGCGNLHTLLLQTIGFVQYQLDYPPESLKATNLKFATSA